MCSDFNHWSAPGTGSVACQSVQVARDNSDNSICFRSRRVLRKVSPQAGSAIRSSCLCEVD